MRAAFYHYDGPRMSVTILQRCCENTGGHSLLQISGLATMLKYQVEDLASHSCSTSGHTFQCQCQHLHTSVASTQVSDVHIPSKSLSAMRSGRGKYALECTSEFVSSQLPTEDHTHKFVCVVFCGHTYSPTILPVSDDS